MKVNVSSITPSSTGASLHLTGSTGYPSAILTEALSSQGRSSRGWQLKDLAHDTKHPFLRHPPIASPMRGTLEGKLKHVERQAMLHSKNEKHALKST
ncbi:hypothetical protein NQZ68_004780 [Dissostichus eleginoides]|uniref:Nodulation protein NoeC n=1 Tax=Dissostichus eleginoides TaxID=100907 RepID=A0AAD9C7S5_DISEL|nr:hypothetical protein NQZ68_004780 [Dissostichus eleginoides]KAK1897475.1 Nodulation protein NoeC [Dissostichus eleginoides]